MITQLRQMLFLDTVGSYFFAALLYGAGMLSLWLMENSGSFFAITFLGT